MQHLNLSLSKPATSGEPQELFAGTLRADGRVSLIADEQPSAPNGSASVEIDRSEAIRLIDHLREVFGIGGQELRNI
mgnify:CR=1 FL=1